MNKRQRKKRAKKEKRLKPLKDFFKNFWLIMEQATGFPKEVLRGDVPASWGHLKQSDLKEYTGDKL